MRIILILVLCWCVQSLQAQDQERIMDYFSDIEVIEDGTMRVTETIKVHSEGINIQRGIYRSFPVKYRDAIGNNVVVRFEVLEVLKDGRPEPYFEKKEGRFTNLYIGDGNVYLSPGDYTYQITYTTNRQLGYFEDYDELYWNAIAHGWAFQIDRAKARIVLPAAADILQYTAYSGTMGDEGCDCHLDQIHNTTLEVTMNKPLAPYEGLTVALSWPKGIVKEPTWSDRFNWFLKDNRAAFFGLIGLMLVFAYYLYAWLQVGKDPVEGTIIPLFESPDQLSPAATRYVLEMGFDNDAFAASIVSLAVKGAIKIDEKSKVYTLHLLDKDVVLPKGERKLLNALFPGSSTSLKLTNKKHQTVRTAMRALRGSLKEDFYKTHFKLNRKWLWPGVLVTILTLGIMLVTSGVSTSGDDFGIFLWLAIWTVGTTALVSAAIAAWRNVAQNGWAHKATAIFLTLFSLPFVGAEFLVIFLTGVKFPVVLIIIAVLLLATNISFYHWLEAPTIFGRKVMDKIEGFKLYLGKAEKDRIEFFNPPERTPEHFEQLLPFAMALGVANQWGAKFESVLRDAQHAPNSSGGYQPSWYSGSRSFSSMNSSSFASNLSGSFTSALASSSTPPGISSSGGGGFSGGGGSSGGGGGGGGGGGW